MSSSAASTQNGKLYRYNPNCRGEGSNTLITKDIDFTQPNIRKKVYRAYVSYKTGGLAGGTYPFIMTAKYMVNGNGVWANCVIKDADGNLAGGGSASINYMYWVGQSLEWTKMILEPGKTNDGTEVDTNSIFSIKYKIEGSNHLIIDDISVVYREKNAR